MAIDKIGTRAADLENLEIAGTEAARLPVGTTAEREGSPKAGDQRFNSTISLMEYYDGTQWKSIDAPPVVSSISPTTETDANANITITGSNFQSGATVKFVGDDGREYNSPTVTVNSNTEIVAQTPASPLSVANEPYDIVVTNQSGLFGTLADALDAGSAPTWTTASGNIGTIYEDQAISSLSIAATDPDGQSVTYSSSDLSITGVTLNSDGTITGTPNINDTYASGGVTHTFDADASDGTNTATRTFNILRKWNDGSSVDTAAANPQALRDLGITTDDMYYIQQSTMPTAYEMYVNFSLVDGKDWVLVGQWSSVGNNYSPVNTTYTINPDTALDVGMTFKGFSLELGNTNYYGYFSSEQNYSDRGSSFTGTASSGSYSGYRLFLGQAGGHGWYNTSQSPCSWSNSAGSVGAGYTDSSGCGDSWPTNLNFGTGISGQPRYNLATGTVNSWIWMDTLGA